MKQSCIHIYCGDGKGKSTAVTGLAVRAAGSGRRVIFTQFMKDGKSSELKVLRELPGVTVLTCEKQFGFFWNMTDEQKKMIEKLNEDNRKLNDVNKGMKEYAKYRLVVGILVVTIIIVLFFVQHNT